MYKYGGLLVYQSHDDDGIIEVVESEGVRSLHFGSYPRQTSMRLKAPDKLELEYVRAMTSWLLFKDIATEINPALNNSVKVPNLIQNQVNDISAEDENEQADSAHNALIMGLGGGSIPKFLLKHFPTCRLKAIEYRKSVVKIARSHFGLPMDPRLKIIIDDAGQYLRQRVETYRQSFSLLIIDAFDHEGMAHSICNEDFFIACKNVLKKDGMLVINLWGGTSNPSFQQVSGWIGSIFDWKILFLPVPNRGNIICLAFNSGSPLYSMKSLRVRAEALEQYYQIEFTTFLKTLKKHNSSTFNHLITA
jgi:spermidine synthase